MSATFRNTRIYYVTTRDGDVALVRASSKSQAIRHVADRTIKAEVASQERIVDTVQGGIKVETAGDTETASLPGLE